MKNKLSHFLLIAFAVVLLDQILKILIIKQILPIPFSTNTGAGFGILQGMTDVLIWISIAIIGLITYYHDKIALEDKYVHMSVALILGGAVGNLIDRIRLGYVIDFINLRIWPSFNIADAAITVGAIGLIYYSIKKK